MEHKYIIMNFGNGYHGCYQTEKVELADIFEQCEVTEEDIDEYVYQQALENAESYEYVATGYGNDFESEEDRDFYYENIDWGWRYCDEDDNIYD